MCVNVRACMNFLTFLRISLRKFSVLPAVSRFNASAARSYREVGDRGCMDRRWWKVGEGAGVGEMVPPNFPLAAAGSKALQWVGKLDC